MMKSRPDLRAISSNRIVDDAVAASGAVAKGTARTNDGDKIELPAVSSPVLRKSRLIMLYGGLYISSHDYRKEDLNETRG